MVSLLASRVSIPVSALAASAALANACALVPAAALIAEAALVPAALGLVSCRPTHRLAPKERNSFCQIGAEDIGFRDHGCSPSSSRDAVGGSAYLNGIAGSVAGMFVRAALLPVDTIKSKSYAHANQYPNTSI